MAQAMRHLYGTKDIWLLKRRQFLKFSDKSIPQQDEAIIIKVGKTEDAIERATTRNCRFPCGFSCET